MAERESLLMFGLKDALQITSKIGGVPNALDDPEHGKGYLIEVTSKGLSARLEIYPIDGKVRLVSANEKLEISNMSKPHFTEEGVIFQNYNEADGERYILIGKDGEVVYLSGPTPEALERIGVPIKTIQPPPHLSASASASLPDQL